MSWSLTFVLGIAFGLFGLFGLCRCQETAATVSVGVGEGDDPGVSKTLQIVRGLKNVSKETGDFLKLRCEVSGVRPATEFRWLVNDALLVEEKNRVKVKTNLDARPQWSMLRIRDLETLDKAFYKCIATNGIDTVSSQVSTSTADYFIYIIWQDITTDETLLIA